MTTHYRSVTSGDEKTFMMTSHSALPGLPLDAEDKDKFLELLEKFIDGYFVALNDFVILDNHFHLELTLLEEEAGMATDAEILNRYTGMWGDDAVPPNRGYVNGLLVPDADRTGITRLRKRLASPACFMQVVKQYFSRYYNKKHNRKGYFWDGRYHSVPLQAWLSRVAGAAYMGTNPIKAKIVGDHANYRWCREGLQKSDPKLYAKLITPMAISHQFVEEYLPHAERQKSYDVSLEELMGTDKGRLDFLRVYINRVLHGEDAVNAVDVDPRIVASVKSIDRQLNIQKFNQTGARNLTRGVAVGSYDMILEIQKKTKRKRMNPRALMDGGVLFATRNLK